ncbi:MAG TPA: DUF1615 domain-containing protein [Steroidobacteraceae bacterium]|nr:DUF1615 domain-containing protein [Steroidobacteraceae bacterium]
MRSAHAAFQATSDIPDVRRFLPFRDDLHGIHELARVALVALAAALGACSSIAPSPPAAPLDPVRAHALIDAALPRPLADRAGWNEDLYQGFTRQSIDIDRENVCAVAAVIQQESGFRVNPTVPNLPAIAWNEIDARAAHAGVPRFIVHGALALSSRTGHTYAERIDAARTEKDLSDVYQDFIGSVPLGQTLFADRNPIRTRGPMQVNVTFARAEAARHDYPYRIDTPIEEELFNRRGGLYFGISHLLGYRAPYDRFIFRFADFNAGRYSSRNAAFQSAVSAVSGAPLTPDGALLPRGEGDAQRIGATERALRSIESRLGLSDAEIREALETERTVQLERTRLYSRVFALAERTVGHRLPSAILPRIDLHGPKITRRLTTEWYAKRVDGRFEACLKRS